MGKNIGGTVGAPFEGIKEFVSCSLSKPGESLPNDDLDLQLVWLDILRGKGPFITSLDLARGWQENITYPFDEYGVAISNLNAGLKPPATGFYNNWFCGAMGASIRSEIWACLFPGRPGTAGWYAYQDASVDHWNEGIYGEVFLAALESAAFCATPEPDIFSLVKRGLSFIPENSKVFRVVKLAVSSFLEGKTLGETREKILAGFGHHNFTDCVQNIGFIIAGLLYGKGDFWQTIVTAVRCGYDADCTGAAAGAIAGIISGGKKLVKGGYHAGSRIVPGPGIKGISVPRTIEEMAGEIAAIRTRIENEENLPVISPGFLIPPLPEFERPFSLPFSISEPFIPGSLGIKNGYDAWKSKIRHTKKIFDSFFFDLSPYFLETPSAVLMETNLILGENKKLKLFPASTDGIKMWIDGKLKLSHHLHSDFLPAPHRPGSPLAEVELGKGKHRILLEVRRCAVNFEFAWIVAEENNHIAAGIQYR